MFREIIEPSANYFVPRRGYRETFANWETKERGADARGDAAG